jgi:ribosome-associated heat shock protein Hsp15
MDKAVRIDKYLWACRVFKTRTQAAEACKKAKVKINDMPVKASRELHGGETILVEREQLWLTYRVLDMPESRVSASLAVKYIENLTPPEKLEDHRIKMKLRSENRPFGLGRPTKKERRIIEKFKEMKE